MNKELESTKRKLVVYCTKCHIMRDLEKLLYGDSGWRCPSCDMWLLWFQVEEST